MIFFFFLILCHQKLYILFRNTTFVLRKPSAVKGTTIQCNSAIRVILGTASLYVPKSDCGRVVSFLLSVCNTSTVYNTSICRWRLCRLITAIQMLVSYAMSMTSFTDLGVVVLTGKCRGCHDQHRHSRQCYLKLHDEMRVTTPDRNLWDCSITTRF